MILDFKEIFADIYFHRYNIKPSDDFLIDLNRIINIIHTIFFRFFKRMQKYDTMAIWKVVRMIFSVSLANNIEHAVNNCDFKRDLRLDTLIIVNHFFNSHENETILSIYQYIAEELMDLSYYQWLQDMTDIVSSKYLYKAIHFDFDFNLFFKRFNIYYNREDLVLPTTKMNAIMHNIGYDYYKTHIEHDAAELIQRFIENIMTLIIQKASKTKKNTITPEMIYRALKEYEKWFFTQDITAS